MKTKLSWRRAQRVCFHASFAIAAGATVALAQVAPTSSGATAATLASGEVVKLDPYISTGTRFDNRTVLESMVPIDVINVREMTAGGQTDLGSMLAASIPSITFPPITAASDASFARPIRLRGLASNELLILVGGKRLYQSSWKAETDVIGPDINSLPPNAFSSIEVLRDGAAAQYGSDAIAGVINFILKRDKGYDISTLAGRNYAGDGSTLETSLDGGIALQKNGYVHASAYYRFHDFTNRQGPDRRQQYFGTRNGQPVVFGTLSPTDNTPVLLPGDAFDPREAAFDRNHHFRRGDPRLNERGIMLNGEQEISPGLTVYGYGGAMERVVVSPYNWRRALDDNTVRAIFPSGYQPMEIPTVTDLLLSGGVKGRSSDWHWDISETLGRNQVSVNPANTLNPSMGTTSPTSFDAGSVMLQQALTMVDLTRSFNIGRPTPLDLALGLEFRRENYRIKAGEPNSYQFGGVLILDGPNRGRQSNAGSQGYPGFQPSDEVNPTRDNVAGYVDLEHHLTKEWDVSIAGRAEHFTNAGDTFTSKLATRFELTPAISLRGSISTGFRAPSLVESFYNQSPTIFQNGVSFITKHFPVSSPAAAALGAKPLKPEKSVSKSLGITAKFMEDAGSLSLDVYQVEVDNQINRTSLFNDASTQRYLIANGFNNVAGATFFLNSDDIRTRGMDITARYNLKFSNGGRLALTSAVNFNQPFVKWVAPTPPQLAAVTTIPIFDRTRVIGLEYGRPRRSFHFDASYQWKQLEFSVREVRYGEYRTASNNAALDQAYRAKWVTDAELTYHVTKVLTVSVGASNAFDIYPDKVLAAANPSGVTQYSGGPFGYNGGFYFTRVALHFK
ncbi:MAG: TonB-dependent receptor [Opitutus sp.]|nr:TonB-dependent receptor [Opitutus sp.]